MAEVGNLTPQETPKANASATANAATSANNNAATTNQQNRDPIAEEAARLASEGPEKSAEQRAAEAGVTLNVKEQPQEKEKPAAEKNINLSPTATVQEQTQKQQQPARVAQRGATTGASVDKQAEDAERADNLTALAELAATMGTLSAVAGNIGVVVPTIMVDTSNASATRQSANMVASLASDLEKNGTSNQPTNPISSLADAARSAIAAMGLEKVFSGVPMVEVSSLRLATENGGPGAISGQKNEGPSLPGKGIMS